MLQSKILVTTYHHAFFHKAGGEFELFEVALSLKKLGVFADIYGPFSRSLDSYDIILHFSMHAGGLEALRAAKAAGKTIVLWPNLWITDPAKAPIGIIKKHIELADLIVIKSQTEKEHLQSLVPVPNELFCHIHSGVDACYGVPTDRDLFRTAYQLKEYILWVGIFEESKNQLTAINALKNSPIPVVFIGDVRDKDYFKKCSKAMPPHFMVIPFLPPKSDLFRSALQGCKAYLEIPCEPPGVSALEAAIAGAPLVLKDDPWTREHLQDHVIYVDPNNPESICEGVQQAFSLDKTSQEKLVTRMREKYVFPTCLIPMVEKLRQICD
jgi:glycosyltransferase involved in cell wall biosynthesis